MDCTENEQKAVSKHDEIQQSRQGMLDRLEVLANEKRVHLDEHKAVTKYAFHHVDTDWFI